MNKEVRVVLSLVVGSFLSGISRARSGVSGLFSSIKSGAASAVAAFNNVVNALAHLPEAFRNVANAISAIFQPAIQAERLERQFRFITGSAAEADVILSRLRETAKSVGVPFEELAAGARLMAQNLKLTFGEVDPAVLDQLARRAISISLVTGKSIQEISEAMVDFLSGQKERLGNILGVNLQTFEDMADAAEKAQTETQGLGEQQLGEVTRVAGDAETQADDAIDSMEDLQAATRGSIEELMNLTDQIGAGADVLDDYAESTESRLQQVKARWDEFVLRLSEHLLPILEDALTLLIAFMDEHKEEINRFLDNVGQAAQDLWETLKDIDWQKVGEDIGEAGDKIASAWDWVLEAVEDIRTFIKTIERLWDTIRNAPDVQQFLAGAANPMSIAQAGKKQLAGQTSQAQQWAANAGAASQQAAIQQVQVEVTATVDDEGQLKVKQVAQKQANTTLAEFINELGARKSGA